MNQFNQLPSIFWNADGTPAGTTNTTPKVTTETVENAPEKEPSETLDSTIATRDELFVENTRLKTRIAQLNRESAGHRNAAKLSETDKAELDAYRALGKADEIKTRLESGQAASEKAFEYERLQNLEKAAKANGFKPALLKRLAPRLPVIEKEIEVKDEDGKFSKETRFFFKDGEKETEIARYFEGDDETLELLKAEGEGEQKVGHVSNSANQSKKFVQQGGGTVKTASGADAILQAKVAAAQKKREERKNPLMR